MNIVTHNLLAMNTNRQLGITTRSKAKSTEKLSSGYRINRSADDAAGLAISEKMRRQIRGLTQGVENTQDGVSFVQIGDGAMNEVHDILHRMTELSVKAANGTCTEDDRSYIDQELQLMKKEINRIADTTVFNEIPIFDNHSVTFGLAGTPKDLEIFDATYDSDGKLVTYGGFLFHGERIPWNTIAPDMVTTDKNNQQVFTGGTYHYESANTNFSFDFRAEKGAKLPVVTRKIDVLASTTGLYLNNELFTWDKVTDLDGKSLSNINLHGGPWSVEYYGATFSFTVPEPVESIESLATDVSAKKSASVSYDWEVYYGPWSDVESAINVQAHSVKNSVVTQSGAYDMAVDAGKKGVQYTVRADDDGIWLETNVGIELSGSKMTWNSLGIESWEDGMKVPGHDVDKPNGPVNYTYKNDETGLSFTFTLSDITSKDSVIDGLDGMKITSMPVNTDYTASVTVVPGGDLNDVTIMKQDLFMTFPEEYASNRDFNEENWIAGPKTASYNIANNAMSITFNGGYRLEAPSSGIDASTVVNRIFLYLWEAESYNFAREIAGEAQDYSFDKYTGTTDANVDLAFKHIAGDGNRTSTLNLNVSYDLRNVLSGLIGNKVDVKASMQETSLYDENNDYVKNDNGKGYVRISDYLKEQYAVINKNDTLTAEEKIAEKKKVENDVKNNRQKYTVDIAFIKKDGAKAEPMDIAKELATTVCDDIAKHLQVDMTADDFCRTGALKREDLPNIAYRPAYIAAMKETPLEHDIYIVHSGISGDRTGIPRYAMNITVMGLATANCKTMKTAEQTITATKQALAYVSAKRSNYGALQNRFEHTINNNNNICENTVAAESRIRDTDMAKEMVQFSMDNILEQVGQAMLAQANQSNQGVLSLLQ